MTDILWGDPIPVDGKRPDWLRDETIKWAVRSSQEDFGETDSRNFDLWTKGDWGVVCLIKLPADHPYYTVQRHNAQNGTNFTYWPGGETAPDDWDGDGVLFRYGGDSQRPVSWRHALKSDRISDYDVIGYTRRAEPTAATDGPPPALWAMNRVLKLVGGYKAPGSLPDAVEYAFARYIEQHEQPPVDPDVLAVREILAAWNSETCWAVKPLMDGVYDPHPRFVSALAAYRKHRQ